VGNHGYLIGRFNFLCQKELLSSLDILHNLSSVGREWLGWERRKEKLPVSRFWTFFKAKHLEKSWIKGDQLDVTCFIISLFNAQHVSDVNTSILRSLRLMCWVISWVVLIWFDVCWCYVVVWLWWCGTRMQAEVLVLQSAYGYHTTTAKPQCNTNTHRTRAIHPMK